MGKGTFSLEQLIVWIIIIVVAIVVFLIIKENFYKLEEIILSLGDIFK